MIFNEVRKDCLLDRWVVIATERGRRPSDFAEREGRKKETGVCPLCPGNEHMTPPAVLVYLESDKRIRKVKDENGFRHKNWLIRCVPNLYPAFAPLTEQTRKNSVVNEDCLVSSVGHHEVLVESSAHDAHPSDADTSQLVHVIDAYADRLRDLSARPYVKYVSVFRNHGVEAGASLSHAHSQIIAMPFVPKIVADEIEASRKFWQKHKECVFCNMVGKELSGPRLIMQDADYAVFAPWASVHPLEFWILPKRHEATPLNMSQEEVEAFARILKTCFNGLKRLVNDPPYNFGFHLALDKKTRKHYHWHLEVYPKLAVWGGYEKSTGTYINTIPPEVAAESLRTILMSQAT